MNQTPRRQRVNYKLEIHQLALYQGKEGIEGDTKQEDVTPDGTHISLL